MNGDRVELKDEVWVRSTGRLASGVVFDTNRKPGFPAFHFVVGNGSVIKGWDQGIIGMRVGEERRLSIPSQLAYGSRGTKSIPPDSDLIFDVELLEVLKPKDADVITAHDVMLGHGRRAKQGDSVIVDCVAKSNGIEFDDSKNVKFRIGGDEMEFPGFDKALIGMSISGVRMIRVPPKYFRFQQSPPFVGEFKVTLKAIK